MNIKKKNYETFQPSEHIKCKDIKNRNYIILTNLLVLNKLSPTHNLVT